jgi:hypothetical protein
MKGECRRIICSTRRLGKERRARISPAPCAATALRGRCVLSGAWCRRILRAACPRLGTTGAGLGNQASVLNRQILKDPQRASISCLGWKRLEKIVEYLRAVGANNKH